MMKTKLFTLVFAVLVLGACKKEIKLDVKQIHLTDTTGQWDIKIDRPAFSTTDAETEKSCVKFNDEVNGLINGIHAAFIEQAKENIACLNSAGFKQAAPYELIIEDSVFLADQNYISVPGIIVRNAGRSPWDDRFLCYKLRCEDTEILNQ